MSAQRLYIVAAKRTPFGTFGGKLKTLSATDLAVHSSKAAIAEAKIDPKLIDSSIFGNVAQTSSDAAYLARHVALRSGMTQESIALTVNRLCGSGFQSLVSGAYEIAAGEAKVVLAGGSESMSQAPLSVYGQHVRFGHRLGQDLQLQDTLWSALTDSHCKTPMGITAEDLGAKFHVTRQECDQVAYNSQSRWNAANKAGVFNAEIAPIEIKGKKGPEMMTADEHPRVETTPETLAKLPPVFKKDGGLVSAGNASGICDGAASLILASEEAVKKYNLTPLVRFVGWATAGVDPKLMGYGPVPAIKMLLQKTGLTLKDIDQVEINEAFAAQYMACVKDLGLDMNKTNVNGGAIALGHPLGASGARITGHLAHQLAGSKDKKYAIGSACIGGGQGIAVLLERV